MLDVGLSTLGPFQRNVVIIAIVVLIIALAWIGYQLLSEAGESRRWPPIVLNCPDYWMDKSGDGSVCTNPHKLGTMTNKCAGPRNFKGMTSYANNGAKICALKTEMNACNLTWDGVTSVDACNDDYIARVLGKKTTERCKTS